MLRSSKLDSHWMSSKRPCIFDSQNLPMEIEHIVSFLRDFKEKMRFGDMLFRDDRGKNASK